MDIDLIVLAYVLYGMHVLLPLLPAVVIYHLFPDTKVGLSGPLQGLTVKAGGAFAAYVTTVLLGIFLVSDCMELIKMGYVGHFSSEIDLKVQLTDAEGKSLGPGAVGITHPSITLIPPIYRVGEDSIRVRIPGELNEYTFRIEVPGFGEVYVSPDEREIEEKEHRRFKLAEPVEVRQNAATRAGG
jgi:hypothetical protein